MRDRAYLRYQREKHILRKESILRAYQHDSRPGYIDAKVMSFRDVSPISEGSWQPYWYIKHRGMLGKGKIHCSCPICRAKTRNKGQRRKGAMVSSFNYTMADLRRKSAMDADLSEFDRALETKEREEEDTENMFALTKTAVVEAIRKNHFKDTTFTCPDGTKAIVAPCSYMANPTKIEDCDYFLVYWDMPWSGGDTIDKIVEVLNNHEELMEKLQDSRMEIAEYFDKHQRDGWDDDSWGFYSDWHKDLYGFRPHGMVCGV